MPKYAGERSGRVYALLDPRCGCVRYVGKSLSGSPLARHLRDARLNPGTSHKLNWLRSLNEPPLFEVLESGTWTNDEINAAEVRWIAHYRAAADHCELTNMRDGGDGGWVPRYGPHTAESRARMSASIKKWYEQNPDRPPQSAESRAKQSASMRKPHPERSAKIAAYKRKQWEDPEYRAKMTEAGRRGGRAGKGRRNDQESSGGTGPS